MEIPLFLAMTAAELKNTASVPEHIAWMACHFSPYSTTLSNLPRVLPKGSMLMLNDRTPPAGHDPEAVAACLTQTAQVLECSCILLDFQRPDNEETASVVEAVLKQADCPVGVSCCYGEKLDCPLLLPPIPPNLPLEDALKPWQGRELWLELTFEEMEIAVRADGCHHSSLPHCRPFTAQHAEELLHCHYSITVAPEQITFQLGRTQSDQLSLLRAASQLGVTQGVGLWQEMSNDFGT